VNSVNHVVVLMLENRSFDHVLGWLKRKNSLINGLTGGESNPVDPASPMPRHVRVTDQADWKTLLDFDPPHEFDDVTEHIFGVSKVGASNGPGRVPAMNGFYARAVREAARLDRTGAESVMDGYAPGTLPAIHALAREFSICDAWFSSVPGPTWPNRFFAHCGTAGGYLDGALRLYSMPSVFGRMTGAGKTWRIYYHDVPQSAALRELAGLLPQRATPRAGFTRFAQFASDCRNGLPNYSFIEPNYWDVSFNNVVAPRLPGLGIERDDPRGAAANDQHPPMSMYAGDRLVAQVYSALRNSRFWDKSVLLVVWDEHGGFFDHVQPPAARSPDNLVIQENFRFDRLGVRVPAIIASPLVPKGSVCHTLFEHASIPATLRDMFGFAPLTERDRYASSFRPVLSLQTPRRDTPRELPSRPSARPSDEDVMDIDLGPAGRTRSGSAQRLRVSAAKPPATKRSRPAEPPTVEPTRLQESLAKLSASLDAEAALSARARSARSAPAPYQRSAVPDALDFRDRAYVPAIAVAPPLSLHPSSMLKRVLDQEETQACTGYALASLIDYLLLRAKRPQQGPVSPRMLYSMARRYDEWPGSTEDSGSSIRGALKGWFKHGACAYRLWDDSYPPELLPPAHPDPKQDWWHDALLRPLGAYYRVDKDSISDMHAALTEAHAIYASANTHSGWEPGSLTRAGQRRKGSKKASAAGGISDIPFPPPSDGGDGGHAFVIVGYDSEGFIVLNSWGKDWGTNGRARLSYADWRANGWDAWVVQLGVPTSERQQLASSRSLRVDPAKRVLVASETTVRDHNLAPFVIATGDAGRLSTAGSFRTQFEDISDLLQTHLADFRKYHQLDPARPVDVAVVAHGGLLGQDEAAQAAARWVPGLYQAGVFPIFLIWETGLLGAIAQLFRDALSGLAGKAGQPPGELWQRRFERFLAPLGTPLWEKTKANARALSRDASGALRLLFEPQLMQGALRPDHTRLHLIGHSAGSIVVTELASWLVEKNWSIQSLNLLGAALRLDRFRAIVEPRLDDGSIVRLRNYALLDEMERSDPSIPLYSRSLLYLVSRALEGGEAVPLVGLARDAQQEVSGLRATDWITAPGAASTARTHAGFDADEKTRDHLIHALVGPDLASASAPKRTATSAPRSRRTKRSPPRSAAPRRRTRG